MLRAPSIARLACLVGVSVIAGCGARTGLELDAAALPAPDDFDAGAPVGERDAGPPRRDGAIACVPVVDGCGAAEVCGDGSDDDCDGLVDEECDCEPGRVQACFAGPPGRRGVGACQDGAQVCGAGRRWGACEGGVLPDADVCTGRDDLCDGCSDDRICPIDCPAPGDPRVPEGVPFAAYPLTGRDFYVGPAERWRWRIEGGICDRLAPNLESFTLAGGRSENATFTPRLSGDYRVTLSVDTPGGGDLECSWVVHVGGPGLRVEMCYPESETEDLDLYLHRPDDTTPWFVNASAAPFSGLPWSAIPEVTCGWANCEANLRVDTHPITGAPLTRVDWGYADSPLSECENGPLGDQWRDLVGSCANPRLDIDNNLSEGIGLPENINVDRPRDGETFRVMVHNFTGGRSAPVVNVYCGGERVATFGQSPDIVPGFVGPDALSALGVMWRVADVTVHVDDEGETVGCDVVGLHPPGAASGYDVSLNDPRF